MKQIHQNICLRLCAGVINKNGSTEKLGNLELFHFYLAGQYRSVLSNKKNKRIITEPLTNILNQNLSL